MNAALFQKVKDLTKDYGVSVKYLKSITEKMGGKIADDSEDTEAIEECANLIAEVVAETQSEATRWAQRNRGGKKSKKSGNSEEEDDEEEDEDDEDEDDEDDEEDEPKRGKKKSKKGNKSNSRLKKLEEEIAQLKAERAGTQRQSEISALMEKHKIPAHLRTRLAKSIADDEDAEDVISTYKQELITAGLSEEEGGGAKVASQEDVNSAADSLLESITVNKKE